MAPVLLQVKIETELGLIYLVASAKGLVKADLKKDKNVEFLSSVHKSLPQAKILKLATLQLKEYFNKKRDKFELDFDLNGTPFQKKVWQGLLNIPYGQTCSYKELAVRIKNPNAMRAVGSANGKNPLFIFIPCHRVITSDGKIGGYSGGLKMKRTLLNLEGAKVRS